MTSRSSWRMVTDGRQRLHKTLGMSRCTAEGRGYRASIVYVQSNLLLLAICFMCLC